MNKKNPEAVMKSNVERLENNLIIDPTPYLFEKAIAPKRCTL
jgi:hypothetical protein